MADIFPLRASSLTVRFGDSTVLHRASFELAQGARIAVLGPNGAGKSVLLRTLHGLIEPTAGEITWGGSAARPREQAMVFQRPVVLRRSALANIVYGLKVAGVSPRERMLRARDVLEAVGLMDVADRPARVLSGGEQQRLALARAWALGPEVLFLDEPTANLDPGSTRDIEAIVGQIHATGTKIIMTTHNLGQAKRLGDEILFLDGGRLVERSPVGQFFQQPASAEAAAFIRGELP